MYAHTCSNGQKWQNYNTDYSQAVSHPSTRSANNRLTSEIGRDPVELVCMVVAEKEFCLKFILDWNAEDGMFACL